MIIVTFVIELTKWILFRQCADIPLFTWPHLPEAFVILRRQAGSCWISSWTLVAWSSEFSKQEIVHRLHAARTRTLASRPVVVQCEEKLEQLRSMAY